jgi:hypothetical protein
MTAPWKLPPDLEREGLRVPDDIIAAMQGEKWWLPWYRGESWGPWKSFLRAAFSLSGMSEAERAIYQECTGRDDVPTTQAKEVYCIVGRRGGKSRIMATVAAWLSAFVDWRPHLAPGERAHILLIAADKKQARVSLRYLRSLLVQHGLLKQLVSRDIGEIIELTTGTTIEILAASFRTTRGYSVAAIILDELAFFKGDEGSTTDPDEIVAALKPAMSTMPGSMLMAISSPHAQRGPLWEAFRKHYGKASDRVMVWRAPTRVMNPTVDQQIIDEALEEDAPRASAEYMAQFRTDVESFISREVVDACTIVGRHELPRMSGTSYVAFVDASAGSSDSYSLAIMHRNPASGLVLDLVREIRPPFSPEEATWQLAGVVKSYGLTKVVGDRWGGEWPREQFRNAGVEYEVAELTKSQIYTEALPVFNAHRIELLDHARLRAQLLGLERRTARGGRESIDHAPHAHDDIANAVAGAITMLAGNPGMIITPAFLQAIARGSTPRHALRERMMSRGF